MNSTPNASYSITIRAEIQDRVGMFAAIATAISVAGGDIGAIDIISADNGVITRDISVDAGDEAHGFQIAAAIKKITGVKILNVLDRTYFAHHGGKIEIKSKLPLKDRNDLSMVYTPGVARVCKHIHKEKAQAYNYTIKGNSVAVLTDGTAVLGLGDIGPEAALPVMEGKAMIFKEFAGVDAFPICLNTKDKDEIINIAKSIAPVFGGINLEDISAPKCFEIEGKLRKMLDIPVMHDDQHGTAVIVLAALINSSRLINRKIEKLKVVIAGAGAAGTATARILHSYGISDIVVCDTAGTLYRGRKENMNAYKKSLARITNPRKVKGSISDAMKKANVIIGLSGPDIITVNDIKAMAKDPIVFALANPNPEIRPELAYPHARIVATGRSDYPNQINNMLSFPGIFRGLLDVRAKGMNEDVLLAAAQAIASTISKEDLREDFIIPSIFNKEVVAKVAAAVSTVARNTGIARI